MKKQKNFWLLTPFFGTILFAILYVLATLFYPGGSQLDKNAVGFSWANNYWCNLLGETAINGQYNTARHIAFIGQIVFCLALLTFWFIFANQMKLDKLSKPTIQISGTLSMFTALFLSPNEYHDLVVNIASTFGIIAILGIFVGLFKNKWYRLFIFGFLIVFLIGLNNYVYYHNKELMVYLPVIQAISFAAFLIWISCININLYHRTTFSSIIKDKNSH